MRVKLLESPNNQVKRVMKKATDMLAGEIGEIGCGRLITRDSSQGDYTILGSSFASDKMRPDGYSRECELDVRILQPGERIMIVEDTDG